ncbi:hypothetical protein [Ferrimonas lipolytica]|uniref:Uncharacterized protein n=1 Tax=Ferrimonas lipolytica TaxID=2724191 RepID=A0A6H1UDN0_9GAMM|nr:hypothetical protein [Ferrimonas lipolytica]QIZ76700.1 hypothetical protein HER31_07340 [Ferrimonas lipolytica]
MRSWALGVVLIAVTATTYAQNSYPKYYNNVDHMPAYQQALVKEDWYLPTAQQRALVAGLLSTDLVRPEYQWKVQQMVYDPNFYEGIRRVGSEVACLIFRYSKRYYERTTCNSSTTSKKIEAAPFIDKDNQFFAKPLIIESPTKLSGNEDLRYQFWIPAGNAYAQSKRHYPVQRLGHDYKNANPDDLVLTTFVTIYEKKDNTWRKFKLSNQPITMVLKIPSIDKIAKNKTAQQAFRQTEHSVRILDYRE